MLPIDLHTHTTASDGTDTPRELIDLAINNGLKAIAITDHDTTEGLIDALNYSKNLPIEVISGVEFSTTMPSYGFDIHILGYYFNPQDETFNTLLDGIRQSRTQRNFKILDQLGAIGFHLTMEEVAKAASDGVITRAHIGKALVKKGYIKKEQIAYDKYIGNNCVAYVPRERLTPEMAIKMILNAGGVPVLAHPTLYKLKLKDLDKLVSILATYGLKGIEAVYSLHAPHEEKYLRQLAENYQLLITGGSDYHGTNKPYIHLGTGKSHLFVQDILLEPLKKASSYYQSTTI